MADINPQPLPPRPEIVVKVPANILFDVEGFHRAQRSVLTRLGCSSCTSGFDILWRVLHQPMPKDGYTASIPGSYLGVAGCVF